MATDHQEALVSNLMDDTYWQAVARTHGYAAGDPAAETDESDVQNAREATLGHMTDLLEMLKELVAAFDDEVMGHKRKEQAEIVIALAEGRL